METDPSTDQMAPKPPKYSCPDCDYTTHRSGDLVAHMQNTHRS